MSDEFRRWRFSRAPRRSILGRAITLDREGPLPCRSSPGSANSSSTTSTHSAHSIVIEDAAVLIDDGRILWSGRPLRWAPHFRITSAMPNPTTAEVVNDDDIENGTLTSASAGVEVDTIDVGRQGRPARASSTATTTLIFAGDRSEEFAARMAGQKYSAGGIATTVAATRAASDEELEANLIHLMDPGHPAGHDDLRDQVRLRTHCQGRAARTADHQSAYRGIHSHCCPRGPARIQGEPGGLRRPRHRRDHPGRDRPGEVDRRVL